LQAHGIAQTGASATTDEVSILGDHRVGTGGQGGSSVEIERRRAVANSVRDDEVEQTSAVVFVTSAAPLGKLGKLFARLQIGGFVQLIRRSAVFSGCSDYSGQAILIC